MRPRCRPSRRPTAWVHSREAGEEACVTREEFDQVRLGATSRVREACEAAGIRLAWVDVGYEFSCRLDVDRQSQCAVHEWWRVSAEVHGPDGLGSSRHQIVKGSARKPDQAVAQVLGVLEGMRVRTH